MFIIQNRYHKQLLWIISEHIKKSYTSPWRGDKNTIMEKLVILILTKERYLDLEKFSWLCSRNIYFLTVNMAVLLCSVFVLLYVSNVQSLSKTCDYRGRNYNECAVMFWTSWNTCTGGHGMKPTQCAVGMEKRQKAICCPRTAMNETTDETFRHCKANCYMTDDDFSEVRRLPTTCTTGTRMFCYG